MFVWFAYLLRGMHIAARLKALTHFNNYLWSTFKPKKPNIPKIRHFDGKTWVIRFEQSLNSPSSSLEHANEKPCRNKPSYLTASHLFT